MPGDDRHSRRRFVRLAGATAGSVLVGGCFDRGPRGGGPHGGGHRGGDADDDGDGGEAVTIDPGTDIEFSAQTTHWEGLAPSAIEGAENPTLILETGAEYTIGWTEGDGGGHNIEIRDESGAVVDGLETEVVTDPGRSQLLEITADAEMARYVCDPHENSMRGTIEVE